MSGIEAEFRSGLSWSFVREAWLSYLVAAFSCHLDAYGDQTSVNSFLTEGLSLSISIMFRLLTHIGQSARL